MTFELRAVQPAEAGPFGGFTFPAYQHLVSNAAASSALAVGLLADGEPAGLALGRQSADDPAQAVALSIFVAKAHRRSGVGGQLLSAWEQETARRGYRSVIGSVSGSDDRSLPVERLLDKAGWQFSGPTSVLCHASQESMISAPWLAGARLPAGMEMFPWSDLGAGERAEMLARQQQEPWIPERLSPFWNEPLIAGCSVGLRHRGRVAGWCVTYCFEGDTLRWWRLFVEPGLQGLGRALPLLAETIRRAPAFGFRYGFWSVSANNEAMMRLLQRRMRPWLLSAKPVWHVVKWLGPCQSA